MRWDYGRHAYARTWAEAMARANLRFIDRKRKQRVVLVRPYGMDPLRANFLVEDVSS